MMQSKQKTITLDYKHDFIVETSILTDRLYHFGSWSRFSARSAADITQLICIVLYIYFVI